MRNVKPTLHRVASVWYPSILLKKRTKSTVPERKHFKRVIRYVWENYPKNTYDIACVGRASAIGRNRRIIHTDIAIYFKNRSDANAFRKISKNDFECALNICNISIGDKDAEALVI